MDDFVELFGLEVTTTNALRDPLGDPFSVPVSMTPCGGDPSQNPVNADAPCGAYGFYCIISWYPSARKLTRSANWYNDWPLNSDTPNFINVWILYFQRLLLSSLLCVSNSLTSANLTFDLESRDCSFYFFWSDFVIRLRPHNFLGFYILTATFCISQSRVSILYQIPVHGFMSWLEFLYFPSENLQW